VAEIPEEQQDLNRPEPVKEGFPMINIAQSNPVAWSPPMSGATALVAAVAAIRPLQESARNGQPGAGRERESPASHAERRVVPSDSARATPGLAEPARGAAGDVLARREVEQAARRLAAEETAEQARRAQRQELLTNVWKASAAVVERVLGLDDGAAVSPAAVAPASPSHRPIEQLALPWPVMPQDAGSSRTRADFPAPQDVVAYDERGNSNLASLETGVLLSRRV
jgi:hypothetical protein